MSIPTHQRKTSTRAPSILRLMESVLDSVFGGDSWATWKAVLRAAFGLRLSATELEIYRELTGRERPPTRPVRELWLLIGRRGGKGIVAALIVIYLSCVKRYRLSPGETPTVGVIAADRRQARIVKKYISGLLHAAPVLKAKIASETADRITLTNGVCIEIMTASSRVSRGYTYVAVVADETAWWANEDSADPDREILNAIRPGMATVDDAMLVVLSSVYSRKGEVWNAYQRHYGREDDPVLVVKGPSRTFNPTISQAVIDRAYADDPIAAGAEWGSEFRSDLESFVTNDAIDAVTMPGRFELPPTAGIGYVGFLDAAGGSGSDSMTLAIAHVSDGIAVLDLIREVRPPFSPEAVTSEFAETIKPYVVRVFADRYAGDWVTESFGRCGIQVTPARQSKSDLYAALLPAINSGRVELLDHERLRRQLLALERRTGAGKDRIDHPPRAHDDVINAAAGALVLATKRLASAEWTSEHIGAFADLHDALRREPASFDGFDIGADNYAAYRASRGEW